MKSAFKAIVTAIILLSLAAPVAAGPFEDAVVAYERGDYATALPILHPLADQGNSHAQFILGLLYHHGRGVPQNYTEAVTWYRRAADKGEAGAQLNLGVIYLKGTGVPKNYAEAEKWLRLAADQGDAGAQFNLGVMLDNGRGVSQDYVAAHMWFNLSVAQGNEKAVIHRGIVATYLSGTQLTEAQKLAGEWKPKPKR